MSKRSTYVRLAMISTIILGTTVFVSAQDAWSEPADGWTYAYEAAPGDDEAGVGGFTALDGTWGHDNGSDQWDGLGFRNDAGEPDGAPGGVEALVGDEDETFLRLQDTGDPRGDGLADPSNRKLYFGHDITVEGASDTIIDDGVTLNFRIRVPTGNSEDDPIDDLAGGLPYPETGDGYNLHNGGKSSIGIKQSFGGIISFSLATIDDAQGEALVFNDDTVIALDPLEWNEFWVTIEADVDAVGFGTHLVTVYMNGDTDAVDLYSVSTGDGSDYNGFSYITIGLGSTGASGALDVDFLRWAPDVVEPEDGCKGGSASTTRSIDRPNYFPGDTLTVTIAVTGVTASTRISDTFPDGFTIANANGGAVNGRTIDFTLTENGEVSYTIRANDDEPLDCAEQVFRGEAVLTDGCPAAIGGDSTVNNATNGLTVERTIDPAVHAPGDLVTVTLAVTGIVSETTITDTFPATFGVDDPGGGDVNGGELSFTVTADGDLVYTLEASTVDGECSRDGVISGVALPTGGCEKDVGGDTAIPCDGSAVCGSGPDAIDAEYIIGFQFGVRNNSGIPCESPSGEEYVMVEQISPEELLYDEERGWGYEDLGTGVGGRGGYDIFGPFDDSPNNRNRFVTDCSEEVYDSFIGSKNFLNQCDQTTVGTIDEPNPDDPCEEGGIDPEGAIFRIDLPDGADSGCFRFVAAFGDADNPHAHRVLVEDGGFGQPFEIGPDFVVLVNNFDQNQQGFGETTGDCLGCGVFARVGFDGKLPPRGDGIAPDPQFANMDENGMETAGCPNSPTIEIFEGYLRVHLLQGNANLGPGSKSGGTSRDANGGDVVVFEVWRLDECPKEAPTEDCSVEGDEDGNGLADCDDPACDEHPACTGPRFVRGDSNSSGVVDLTDGVVTLGFLFTGGPAPSCQDAADTDNNAGLVISDAVIIFSYLFTGGPAPVPPSPSATNYAPGDCGLDTDASIGCLTPADKCS